MESRHAAIARLFHPRNVVLVGTSDRPDHWSRRVWDNLKRFGFAGRVMPVNPNRSEIWGVPCFRGLAALPEAPDHLVLFRGSLKQHTSVDGNVVEHEVTGKGGEKAPLAREIYGPQRRRSAIDFVEPDLVSPGRPVSLESERP